MTIKTIFRDLGNYMEVVKSEEGLIRKAKVFYFKNLRIKALTALHRGLIRTETERVVQDRVEMRIRKECMLKWQKAQIIAHKLKSFVSLLESEHDSRMMHKVFPRMIHYTYVLEIFDHMKERRNLSYKEEFFNQVRK